MEAQIDRARPEDYDEVIDFANFVFSQAHRPHDFPAALPKLYKREYFMEGIHYLVREEGRIKAAVGAYPLALEFPGGALPGRGIGMVSVHPYRRGRGYMKALMETALEDMRREGVVFSCLSGRRQRYEYFGYTPAGTVLNFTCNGDNIRHALGRDWTTGLSIEALEPGDGARLDAIAALHEARRLRFRRRRDRLYETLSSWRFQVFTVNSGDRFEGFFLAKDHGAGRETEISEIRLRDFALLPVVIGLFLRRQKERGAGDSARVAAAPGETEEIAALGRFAEDYSLGPAYQFAVFDYRRFLEPLLKERARERVLPEGAFILAIEGEPRLVLSSAGGTVSVSETAGPPDLSLRPLEALRFLCTPLAAGADAAVEKNPFLQSLLPLPLFFDAADGV
jgi:predicted N-acetyltransferase YhbS